MPLVGAQRTSEQLRMLHGGPDDDDDHDHDHDHDHDDDDE